MLKPKCDLMLSAFKQRAIKQIDLALRLLIKQGKAHNFNCPDERGKRTDYAHCASCYCNVFRFNDDGELVYFTKRGYWGDIHFHDNATELAQAADCLLEKATAKPEDESEIIPQN